MSGFLVVVEEKFVWLLCKESIDVPSSVSLLSIGFCVLVRLVAFDVEGFGVGISFDRSVMAAVVDCSDT